MREKPAWCEHCYSVLGEITGELVLIKYCNNHGVTGTQWVCPHCKDNVYETCEVIEGDIMSEQNKKRIRLDCLAVASKIWVGKKLECELYGSHYPVWNLTKNGDTIILHLGRKLNEPKE